MLTATSKEQASIGKQIKIHMHKISHALLEKIGGLCKFTKILEMLKS